MAPDATWIRRNACCWENNGGDVECLLEALFEVRIDKVKLAAGFVDCGSADAHLGVPELGLSPTPGWASH